MFDITVLCHQPWCPPDDFGPPTIGRALLTPRQDFTVQLMAALPGISQAWFRYYWPDEIWHDDSVQVNLLKALPQAYNVPAVQVRAEVMADDLAAYFRDDAARRFNDLIQDWLQQERWLSNRPDQGSPHRLAVRLVYVTGGSWHGSSRG